jgi:hypothetical protein
MTSIKDRKTHVWKVGAFAQRGVENLGEKRLKPNPKNKHIHLLL